MTDSVTCANCGASVRATNLFCVSCGAPRHTRASTRNQLSMTMPTARAASASAIVLAIAADVLVAALVGAAAAIGAGSSAVPAASSLAIAVVLAQIGTLLWWGRSAGALLMGLRLVAVTTGSAPGFRRGVVTVADLRGGADPIDPFLPPPSLPAPKSEPVLSGRPAGRVGAPAPSGLRPAAAAVPPPLTAPHLISPPPGIGVSSRTVTQQTLTPALSDGLELTVLHSAGLRAGGTVIVIDGDRRVPVTPRMLIGRNPSTADGETVVAIPDLEREVSKSHLLLEQEPDGSVFVTDLHSTNGTSINGRPIDPAVRVAVDSASTLRLGGHTVRVLSRSQGNPGATT